MKFTVDSALLAELGERLINRPFIALGELVKNSYDADASKVLIDFDLRKDRIIVSDNGLGMTFEEFANFWMLVGSVHKREHLFSRKFHRLMTGSKGVGRLAVQFLSKDFRLETTSDRDRNKKVIAEVKWEQAVAAGKLTEAKVEYDIVSSASGFQPGTTVTLSRLKQNWTQKDIRELAGEIWQLRPPSFGLETSETDQAMSFDIELQSREERIVSAFKDRLDAIETIWTAKLTGKNNHGDVHLSLQFAGDDPITQTYHISNCVLKDGAFDIRIYNLKNRQPHGIKVGEARDYLRGFGGVRVYDSGFQLAHYGKPENDWLGIEVDHSHRLATSKLLPAHLKVRRGLSFLPTMTRILGMVNVNTSTEKELTITITRDRLQENVAFDNLRRMVRWALDFYAMEEARRQLEKLEKEKEILSPKAAKLDDVLAKFESQIPRKQYTLLKRDLNKATKVFETESERSARKVALLGSLATAGMSALAYQHELRQQFAKIEDIIQQLGDVKVGNRTVQTSLDELKNALADWLRRARATNDLFSGFSDPRNIEARKRFKAKSLLDDVALQLRSLARGIPIVTDRVDDGILLPPGSIAEWSSILQNVFTNAFNALIDAKKKKIDVSSRVRGKEREILIQNTGAPLAVKTSDELFEPFVRRTYISPERRALGYGGTGLGLTIVRLIAQELGCIVSFVEPEKGFNAAFSLRWRETK